MKRLGFGLAVLAATLLGGSGEAHAANFRKPVKIMYVHNAEQNAGNVRTSANSYLSFYYSGKSAKEPIQLYSNAISNNAISSISGISVTPSRYDCHSLVKSFSFIDPQGNKVFEAVAGQSMPNQDTVLNLANGQCELFIPTLRVDSDYPSMYFRLGAFLPGKYLLQQTLVNGAVRTMPFYFADINFGN